MTNIYQKRRNALLNQLEDGTCVVIHSGYVYHKTADQMQTFTVNKNFYYLTGIDQDDVILLMTKKDNKIKEQLFIVQNDPIRVKWVGAKLTKKEAEAFSGISDLQISYLNEFSNVFEKILKEHFTYLYCDLEKIDIAVYDTFALLLNREYETELQKAGITVRDIYSLIIRMRMIKDETELKLIGESIATTKRAIENVMKHHQTLNSESVAMAYHDFVLISEAKPYSFHPIIASGINGTILHYEDNNQAIASDSLILMDVGSNTAQYASDITRTIPVSGHFTERQKAVYQAVLDVNKACIAYATAGVTWEALNNYAKHLLYVALVDLGLVSNEDELSKYYFHSIGHPVGLDVHDPADRSLGLLEGMVITIEPGLYIPEEAIGVRIEDNILITSEKAIVLSAEIIKEVADIEKFMA